MLAELRIFEWRGTSRLEQVVQRPQRKAVLEGLRGLEGAENNDPYLHPQTGAINPYLCVGGGAGKYLLTGVLPGDRFPTLIDSSRPELPKQALRVGGQVGLYPQNWIHPLAIALRVVESFWTSGEFGVAEAGAGFVWGES